MHENGASSHLDDMDMIEAYLKQLQRDSFTEATIHSRREILTRLNGSLSKGVGRTYQEELEQWLHDEIWEAEHPDESPRWTQNTKATYWTALRSFYTWAADPRDPWIDEDPTRFMTPIRTVRGEARPVEDEDLWRVLREAREPFRMFALIAAYQGLRCIEISRLDREHITAERLFVVKGKGGFPRVHDTDPMVWAAVKDLPPGPIARRPDGRRADATWISTRAAVHFRRGLKLKGVTMHRFRHWLGVHVQAAYKDVRVTQEVLGHRSLQSTQIYTRATAEQQRAARAMVPRPRAA